MMPNPKVTALGRWTSIPGITYIFDSEETETKPFLAASAAAESRTRHGDLGLLCTRVSAGLYSRIARASVRLSEKLGPGFHPLPHQSYHVTYRDLVCSIDLPALPPSNASRIKLLLDGLPDLTEISAELALPIGRAVDATTFRAENLEIWSGNALVVTLEPVDEVSAQRFRRMVQRRSAQNDDWCKRIGRVPLPAYQPHVSLGYFGDLQRGEEVRHDVVFDTCRNLILTETGSETLTVDRYSLYGFLDMINFFKRVP